MYPPSKCSLLVKLLGVESEGGGRGIGEWESGSVAL